LRASQHAHRAAEGNKYSITLERSRDFVVIDFEMYLEAFFEPGMLALLYFPEEHKYAIYLPLFLPLTVPVISALWSEIKRYQKKKTERKNK
jgi:phosphatidylinositol glycan class S